MMQTQAVQTLTAAQTQAKQQTQHKLNPAWLLLPLLGAGLIVGQLAYMMGTDAATDWNKVPAQSTADVD